MDEAWDEVTPVDWESDLARQHWAERRDENGKPVSYTLHVSCPRCHHKGAIDLEYYPRPLLDRFITSSVIHANIYAQCECTGEHAGRPADETGCGARASIEFSIPAGTDQ